MALFGTSRDIDTFKIVSKELVNDVISQQIGYYKVVLQDTPPNMYGESLSKSYMGPVLLNCLIERGDFTAAVDDFGVDANRTAVFRFLRDDMIDANVFSEVGDIVMYNELFYEVDNTNNNQLIVGKDNQYVYSTGLENYGNNYSVVLECHLTRGNKLNITEIIPTA
jgi:hypothetical protein